MNHRAAVVLLLLFGIPLFFLGLKDTGLKGTDELRYSKIASELEPGRNFFLLHFNGHRYTDKPPMYFWMMRTGHEALGGLSPLAGRLPGALSGLITGLLCYFLAARLLGDRRLALLAAMTLMIMPRFLWISRWIRLDVPMVMFATGAMLVFVENYFRGRRLTSGFFWLLLALSFSIKGPAGPMVILGGILGFLWLQGERRRIREVFAPGGVALFVVLTLAWVLPIVLLGEAEASQDLIVAQNIGRIVDPDRHVELPWYYLENIWHDGFPAMLLLAGAGWYFWRTRKQGASMAGEGESAREQRRAARRLLLCWAGFTLVMFSIYPPKRPQYLLPGYPAAAILAVHLVSVIAERLRAAEGDTAKRLRRAFGVPFWLNFVPIAVVLLLVLWKDVLFPGVLAVVEAISESAAYELSENYAEFEYGGYAMGWALRIVGTLLVAATWIFVAGAMKRRKPIEAYAGLVGLSWVFFLVFFGRVVTSSFDDSDLLRYARELGEKLEERPGLQISVFGEDKPYYNVYGDFPIEYFDDDYEKEFRAYAQEVYEAGRPMLVIVEADEEKEVRGTAWYREMERREATIQGDPIIILESPHPPAPQNAGLGATPPGASAAANVS